MNQDVKPSIYLFFRKSSQNVFQTFWKKDQTYPGVQIATLQQPTDTHGLAAGLKSQQAPSPFKVVGVDPEFKAVFDQSFGFAEALYLAQVEYDTRADSDWSEMSFPEMLRSLPQDRNRLPFLKAMQWLMESHKDKLEAYEIRKKQD